MVVGLSLMACVASGCRCFFYLVEVGEQASDSTSMCSFTNLVPDKCTGRDSNEFTTRNQRIKLKKAALLQELS